MQGDQLLLPIRSPLIDRVLHATHQEAQPSRKPLEAKAGPSGQVSQESKTSSLPSQLGTVNPSATSTSLSPTSLAPAATGPSLAPDTVITDQQLPALAYVWLLANGVLDVLPDQTQLLTVARNHSLLDRLYIVHWANYLNLVSSPIIDALEGSIINMLANLKYKGKFVVAPLEHVPSYYSWPTIGYLTPIERQLVAEIYYRNLRACTSYSPYAQRACQKAIDLVSQLQVKPPENLRWGSYDPAEALELMINDLTYEGSEGKSAIYQLAETTIWPRALVQYWLNHWSDIPILLPGDVLTLIDDERSVEEHGGDASGIYRQLVMYRLPLLAIAIDFKADNTADREHLAQSTQLLKDVLTRFSMYYQWPARLLAKLAGAGIYVPSDTDLATIANQFDGGGHKLNRYLVYRLLGARPLTSTERNVATHLVSTLLGGGASIRAADYVADVILANHLQLPVPEQVQQAAIAAIPASGFTLSELARLGFLY